MLDAKSTDRLRKLIALAARNPNQYEAASAAVTACEILHANLDILDPPEPRIVERVVEKIVYRDRPDAVAVAVAPVFRLFESRYEGLCGGCGGPYEIGDPIVWARGSGCWHVGCRPDKPKPKTPRKHKAKVT